MAGAISRQLSLDDDHDENDNDEPSSAAVNVTAVNYLRGARTTTDATAAAAAATGSGVECSPPGDDIKEAPPQYADRSFHFLTLDNRFRQMFIKWLNTCSIVFLLINCVGLGFMDTCDFDCVAKRCQTLQLVDLAVFSYFFMEMLVKMVAMGVIGRHSYLAQPWNCLDFAIAVLGSTDYVYGKGSISFSAVRTFRVLRPLRAINRVPSLKILVELLLESLPMLGNVLLFAFFIFFAFGVCGIQLWAGILRHRCYFPESAVPGADNFSSSLPLELNRFSLLMPPYYKRPTGDYVCSPHFGILRCDDIPLYEEEGSICEQLFHDSDIPLCRNLTPLYSECLPKGPNPSRETISFDNIGLAWIAIFQIINLENWTEILYLLQDSYSFWVWIYFVILIVIGTFFALNLCLVVITNHFQEAKSRSSKFADVPIDINGSIYVQLLDLIVYAFTQCLSAFRPSRPAPNHQPSNNPEPPPLPQQNHLNNNNNQKSGNGNVVMESGQSSHEENNSVQTPHSIINDYFAPAYRRIQASRAYLRALFEDNTVAMWIMGVIVLNSLIMGAEHHQQPETLTAALENINVAFTCFFCFEVVIKMYAYGFMAYIRDGFNMLDFIIVLANLVELTQGTGSRLFVLRAFRLVRLVKIIRFLPGLQRQLLIMMKTVDNVASFFLLVSLFLFIFAIMGMSLFGCQYCPMVNKYMRPEAKVADHDDDEAPEGSDGLNETAGAEPLPEAAPHGHELVLLTYFACPRTNFDTLPASLFTVLQIFTQDSWTAVLKDGMVVTSEWAGLYFVALVSIGNYILLNLLVAILVEGFSSDDDDDSFVDPKAVVPAITFPNKFAGPSHVKAPLASLESLSDLASESQNQTPIRQAKEPSAGTSRLGFCGNCRLFFLRRNQHSFFLLPPENAFRRNLLRVVTGRYFDNVVLGFIFANCLVTTMERPSIRGESWERRMLDMANYTINGIFLAEAVLKIVAHGFVFGQGAYLRDSWNLLDFILINCSSLYMLFDVFYPNIEEAKFLEILRVLRLLRALRPLRVVNRAPGLKIVVETLLLSVKPIGNIIVITSAFFLIFGILGVQMFRGCFYRCTVAGSSYTSNRNKGNHHGSHMSSEAEMQIYETLSSVRNRSQCEELGDAFEWENDSYNFDNILQSLMTLFVFATFDGWVDITRAGIDCVGVDQQPVNDYNPWRILYFISFLLIVCFFVVNMFVGVVVNNFEKVHKRVLAEKEAQKLLAKKAGPKHHEPSKAKKMLMACLRLTSASRRYSTASELAPDQVAHMKHRRQAISVTKKQAKSIRRNIRRGVIWHGYLRIRLRMYRIFTHKYFELVLVGITTLNVLIMAVEYYQMPRELLLAVKTAGYGFTILLAVEMIMKMVAMGVRRCLRDKWTRLDIFILVASLAEILVEDSYSRVIPINPTIFRILRILRIARVFRLLKTAKGVRRLLDTVSEALPKVAHLSLVFFLLFFIYASLGVELFGKFTCPFAKCGGLSRHASFDHFGMALLTLFRVFTGDKWNGILKDMLHVASDPAYCRKLVDSSIFPDVGVECRTAGFLAPIYFVSFVLASRFVLINVVIAVLMSQLQRSQREEAEDSCFERRNTALSSTFRKAPPNSTRTSIDDVRSSELIAMRRHRRIDRSDSNFASVSGSSFRASYAGGGRCYNLRQMRSPPPSHFSLSGLLIGGRDVSLHYIDENTSVISSSAVVTIGRSTPKRKSLLIANETITSPHQIITQLTDETQTTITINRWHSLPSLQFADDDDTDSLSITVVNNNRNTNNKNNTRTSYNRSSKTSNRSGSTLEPT